jgi:ABC-type branched-subunit amino acid transport system substrate-binding protein
MREAASNIPAEPTAEVHPIAARARSELANIYRRSFIADCAVGGVELVFAGIRDGDEAFALADALRTATRHARGQLHYYEHHEPGQRLSGGELVGLLRVLRTGPSRFAEWHHFSATGLPGAEKPIVPAKHRVRRILTWTAASLVAVLGVAFGVYAVGGGFDEDPCGEPFERDEASGRCPRLDDGSGCVNATLKPACEAVARQNEAIGEDDPVFTIAVALSMTFEGDDASSPGDIANQIQGAAAAQALINENQTPKARILLTDLGPSNSAWDEAAAEILERRRDDKIIAVTGLSASYEDTKLFIDRMRAEGMVVMGSTITGDNMLNGVAETNTTFRVGPTNTQEAVALAAFVREHGDLCKVFNVSDSDRSYDYSVTLNEAFKLQQSEAGCAESPPRPFTYNGANVEEVNPALFNETVAAMCGEIEEDSYLFFAGLSRFALPSLIRSLSLREGDCLDHRITIVTGDNASSIPHDRSVVNDLRAANVNLYYIGLAHPDQWESAGEEHRASAAQMASAVDQLMHQFGTASNLENGQALMSFDAFWVTALNAQGQGETVTADSLADQLRSFSGRTATGPLEFDERGNPVGKTLTVLAATTDLEDPVEVIDLVTAA